MIMVGLSCIRKYSRCLACSAIFSIRVLAENRVRFKMIFNDNVKTSKYSDIITQIIEFKILDNYKVLSGDFLGLKNLSSLIDLSGFCNLTGLNSLNSQISSKNVCFCPRTCWMPHCHKIYIGRYSVIFSWIEFWHVFFTYVQYHILRWMNSPSKYTSRLYTLLFENIFT